MKDSNKIKQAYQIAKDQYAELGINTEEAIAQLSKKIGRAHV